jgi:hypothetical protein
MESDSFFRNARQPWEPALRLPRIGIIDKTLILNLSISSCAISVISTGRESTLNTAQ